MYYHIRCYGQNSFQSEGQSEGQRGNPINNALISNLMKDLESLHNFH